MKHSAQGFKAFVLFTAGLTGALVMAIEVLGARAVAPFFGVSLFVWTALIAVTLLALALGYLVGGMLADRKGSPAMLYGLIGGAGVWVLIIPLIKITVFQAMLPLGLRWGALLSALILFGPPLFLLGCVSPFVVRLATQEWDRLGRTVGLLYAISTAGSFFGTLITGYYVVAAWGVSHAFQASGVLLLGLTAIYFAVFRGRWAAVLLPFLALGTGIMFPHQTQAVLADGTVATLINSQDGFYGRVQVVEYKGSEGHTRELVIDGLVQGGIDVANGQSIYEYGYLLEHLAVAANPQGQRCLVIGLGPGVVPRRFAARGIETEVVDIDPAVVTAARQYFGLPEGLRVHLADARYFLGTATDQYDYIVLDVFNGDTTPGHLLTREALELVRARLAPGGVLALNLMGRLGGERRMTASVMRTLETVFPWVQAYPLFVPGVDGAGNIAVMAGLGKPLLEVPALDETEVHPFARATLRQALAQHFVWTGSNEGIVLTDDYNPIDVLDLPMKEAVRRRILDSTPHELLLS
ncbi:MAG: fused MFS/spermidine synthase [Gallionellaceae bacterium]|nr:fused MFS/spermidine synthase [Gallionellaceae bacterium]